jgi:hypothetical protein
VWSTTWWPTSTSISSTASSCTPLPLPGRHRYADRDQIAGLHERAVLPAVDADDLHEPTDPGPQRRHDHPRGPETPVEAGLRWVWDWITGRR